MTDTQESAGKILSGIKFAVNPSEIKNKIKRSKILAKQKHLKSKIKHKIKSKILKEEKSDPSKKEERLKKNQPKTLENTVEKFENKLEADDTELLVDEQTDEFAEYFIEGKEPKVLVTTNKKATKKGFIMAEEFSTIFPNAQFIKRKPEYDICHICEFSSNRGYTDVLILNEDKKKLNTLTHIHLPNGPTAIYKLSNFKSHDDLPQSGKLMDYKPELILNNFDTRLGRSIGRMFMALFPHVPEFTGRQAVTFHNQRDFIFFRRHRYKFKSDGTRAALQEIGPRFTLKLQSLQKSVYDLESGDYEWIRPKKDGRKDFHL